VQAHGAQHVGCARCRVRQLPGARSWAAASVRGTHAAVGRGGGRTRTRCTWPATSRAHSSRAASQTPGSGRTSRRRSRPPCRAAPATPQRWDARAPQAPQRAPQSRIRPPAVSRCTARRMRTHGSRGQRAHARAPPCTEGRRGGRARVDLGARQRALGQVGRRVGRVYQHVVAQARARRGQQVAQVGLVRAQEAKLVLDLARAAPQPPSAAAPCTAPPDHIHKPAGRELARAAEKLLSSTERPALSAEQPHARSDSGVPACCLQRRACCEQADVGRHSTSSERAERRAWTMRTLPPRMYRWRAMRGSSTAHQRSTSAR